MTAPAVNIGNSLWCGINGIVSNMEVYKHSLKKVYSRWKALQMKKMERLFIGVDMWFDDLYLHSGV